MEESKVMKNVDGFVDYVFISLSEAGTYFEISEDDVKESIRGALIHDRQIGINIIAIKKKIDESKGVDIDSEYYVDCYKYLRRRLSAKADELALSKKPQKLIE